MLSVVVTQVEVRRKNGVRGSSGRQILGGQTGAVLEHQGPREGVARLGRFWAAEARKGVRAWVLEC